MTSITAVIGNHNGEDVLADCLASFSEQTLRPEAVFVVDGGSDDKSRDVTEAHGATFVTEENRGLGYLYNRGASVATTDLVFLGNNDVSLMPDCFEQLAAVLDAQPSAFAADARQLDWARERTIHAGTTLTRGALLREYLPGLHLDHNVPAQRVTRTVCANGAAMLVRRSMFQELGGFDETFFMEWEDLDLCWRAWARGWPSLYVPDAMVRHRVGAVTTAAVRPRRSASSHHNLLRFAFKCLPATAAGRVALGELLRLPRHPRAVASGFAAVARETADVVRYRRANPPSPALFASMLGDPPGEPAEPFWPPDKRARVARGDSEPD